MATHSSILAWEIPWTEKPGGLQSMGWQRIRHNWANEHTHNIYYLNCTCFIVIFVLWLLEDLKLPMWLTLYFFRTALICTVVRYTPAGIFVNRLKKLLHPCPSYWHMVWFAHSYLYNKCKLLTLSFFFLCGLALVGEYVWVFPTAVAYILPSTAASLLRDDSTTS